MLWLPAVKIRVLAVAALIGAALLPLGQGEASTAAARASWPPDAWAQPAASAARARFNPGEQAITATTAGDLDYVASYVAPPVLDSACGRSIQAPPVIARGRLYLAVFGSVSSYDLDTGRLVWRKVNDQSSIVSYAAILVVGDRVFVTSGDCTSESDPSSSVVAYDATTGRRLWSHHFSPAVDLVAYGRHLVGQGSTMGSGNLLIDLDARTGSVRWQRTYEDCRHEGATGYPIVVAGRLLVSACSEDATPVVQTQARSLGDGRILWTLRGAYSLRMGDSPTRAGGAAYGGNPDGRLVSIDARTGQVLWTAGDGVSARAVDDARVYAVCEDAPCALDKTTGGVVWTSSGSGVDFSSVVVTPHAVLSRNGAALEPATGAVGSWALYNDQTVRDLAVAQGTVVVTSSDRIIDVYRLPTP